MAHSSVHNLPHALILFCRKSVFQNLPGKYTIVSKRLNISINIKIKLDLPQLRFAVAFSVTLGLNSWPFCAALSSLFELAVPNFDLFISLASQNNAQIRHKNTINTNSIRPDKFSISSTRHWLEKVLKTSFLGGLSPGALGVLHNCTWCGELEQMT